MSIWGELAGNFVDSVLNGKEINLLQAAEQALSASGGVNGLLASLNSAGLGEQVSSWIGTGSNLPVSAEQITQALSSDQMASIAKTLGIDISNLPQALAHFLPAAVDQASPSGTLVS